MAGALEMQTLFAQYIQKNDHGNSDYFGLIKELVKHRNKYGINELSLPPWSINEIDFYEHKY